MELDLSLQHLKLPVTCSYPEPGQSSPFLPSKFLKIHFTVSLIYAWVFLVVSFPQASPPKSRIRNFSPSYALHAPPISFFSFFFYLNVLWAVQIITLPCYLDLLRPKYLPQHPTLEHRQPMFLPEYERQNHSSVCVIIHTTLTKLQYICILDETDSEIFSFSACERSQ